jgi:hypothetical protein
MERYHGVTEDRWNFANEQSQEHSIVTRTFHNCYLIHYPPHKFYYAKIEYTDVPGEKLQQKVVGAAGPFYFYECTLERLEKPFPNNSWLVQRMNSHVEEYTLCDAYDEEITA